MNASSSRTQRSVGTVLGAMAGDALGWPQELKGGLVGGRRAREARLPEARFAQWIRQGGNRFNGRYLETVQAGEYSDDSQLLLAVARSCLRGENWFSHLTELELPTWSLYQRGGGRAVLSAASSWARGRAPWSRPTSQKDRLAATKYLGAGANGVAMRIAPHALWLMQEVDAIERRKQLVRRVFTDGIATHGHPRALVGALAYAAALDFVLNVNGTIEYGALVDATQPGLIPSGVARTLLPQEWIEIQELEDFNRSWDETIDEMNALLEKVETSLKLGAMSSVGETMVSLGVTDPNIGGAGTVTAAAAIFLASRAAAKPMSALVSSAFQSQADTDTLASMVGGLLGGIHGRMWLTELGNLQDEEYGSELSSKLVSHTECPALNGPSLRGATDDFLRQLDSGDIPGRGIFPDGRSYSLEDVSGIEGSIFVRYRFKLENEQTVLIDRKLRTESTHDKSFLEKRKHFGQASENDARNDVSQRDADKPQPNTVQVSVTLPTKDIYRIALFYSRLLELDFPVQEGNLRLSRNVLFRETKAESVDDRVGAALDLQVRDLHRASVVLGEPIRGQEADRYVIGKDPDGRPVRIHE